MITTVKYNNKNFPIPSERVFEKLLNLEEKLTGQEVKIRSIFSSKDNTPSMVIFYGDEGFYRFKDFSSGRYGDIADVAQHLFDIPSRQDAFIKIKKMFEADPDFKVEGLKRSGYQKTTKEITSHTIRKWNKRDEEYYKEYYIGCSFLKEYIIKPLSEYEITITRGTSSESMVFKSAMSYGYFNKAGELCKIYNPKNTKAKFIKVKEFIQGSEQLKFEAPCLIIASSMKDIGAAKSMRIKGIEYIAPDSENVHVPKDKIDFYKTKYKYIFTMFDNDIAGMKAMKQYQDLYGISYIYFTVEKDIAECVKQHGPSNTKLFFKPVLKDAIRKENSRLNKLK